jgi:MFS family permease
MVGLTAAVCTPGQFYTVRFFLGLAEAGFFPGVVVYLTHGFTARDRAKALSYFLIATLAAQALSPKISNALLLRIGTTELIDGKTIVCPLVMGMTGWQWVYVFWAIPAVLLGVATFVFLTDRPHQATWLTSAAREGLGCVACRGTASTGGGRHLKVLEAMRHPKVVLLAVAYFCIVTGTYGVECRFSVQARWAFPRFTAGETINALCLVIAGLCTFAIAYRFYSKYEKNEHDRDERTVGYQFASRTEDGDFRCCRTRCGLGSIAEEE